MDFIDKPEAIEREGFTITRGRAYDESHEGKRDYLGEYSNTEKPGAIDREARGERGRHEYRFFNPGEAGAEYVEQDYARAESLNRGDWHYEILIVRVYKAGVKLAYESLSGFESDSEDEYLAEEFENLTVEAIAQAKQKLAELRA